IPRIESVAGWKELPIIECGERLVKINDYAPEHIIVRAEYCERGLLWANRDQFLREGALRRLVMAAELLPRGMKIVVWDAWRPLEVQQALFDQHLELLRKEHPGVKEDELIVLAQTYVSLPSSDPLKPSPHFTGGAVDLSLLDESGNDIDMGTKFDHFGPEAGLRYFEKKENEEIKRNRRLLYWVMREAGFSGYDEEWWHFDFGNQFDVKRIGKSNAIYGGITLY
ncbi:M15 family metallopeptidase, partial [Candidatus Curtissbacteria bacterium]|nr:M15 family metallopeptidase [Candidatus Curtissbacteria bacterium]